MSTNIQPLWLYIAIFNRVAHNKQECIIDWWYKYVYLSKQKKTVQTTKRSVKIKKTTDFLKQEMSVDLELKEFKCPRCDNILKTKKELILHMKNNHDNPTQCHFCSKKFTHINNLLPHIYLHLNIKPYKCIKCNEYQSRTIYELKNHFRKCKHTNNTHHNDIKYNTNNNDNSNNINSDECLNIDTVSNKESSIESENDIKQPPKPSQIESNDLSRFIVYLYI